MALNKRDILKLLDAATLYSNSIAEGKGSSVTETNSTALLAATLDLALPTEDQNALLRFLKAGVSTTVEDDQPLPVNVMEGGSSAFLTSTHRSPVDFNVAYTSANTLTLSGHQSIATDSQIIGVRVIRADNTSETLVNASGVTIKHNSDVLTFTGLTTDFSGTDSFAVYIDYQKKAYDDGLDVQKMQEQSPLWTRYTDVENLVTTQDTTSTYVSAGAVIDMKGYNSLSVNIDLDINDATGNSFKFMSCNSDGLNPRPIDGVIEEVIPDGGDYSKTYAYENIFTNYIQMYIKHTANSGVTSDFTVGISKSYN